MLPRLFKADDIRKHQINTLKIFNENVTEVIESEEYDVLFSSGGNNLCLKISLVKEFPSEKPLLKVVPSVVHHWISGDGDITTAPGLLNWTVHSDLGRVVQAIIREFQRNPPPLVISHSINMSPTSPINGEIRASPVNYQTFTNIKNFSPPSHSTQSTSFQSLAIPDLSTLNLEELKFLSENPDRQDEFIDEMPLIKEQNKALGDIIQQVEEMAEANLTREEKLHELQKCVGTTIEELAKLAFENERLHTIYQQLYDKYAPRNIQGQLKIEAEKADKESEKIAESFLGGETDVDKFVNDFIRVKTLSQSRKTKEEKLGQQLDRLEKAGF
ncbi:vacuolar protein sorting-associated protein 37A [Diabrotica virgifera virgifera]|uniref:Vacuolar protein sorting-associated protein 37A n=1 Tax=Diabrotica virgifera virgifera TaxID=50390 RepID=A0A6P7FFF0_DIAVI|nr:vacuolar protein sorting-associated protein 37A [Diabrotica virgifera virgifera]